jgi:hypothetical protein
MFFFIYNVLIYLSSDFILILFIIKTLKSICPTKVNPVNSTLIRGSIVLLNDLLLTSINLPFLPTWNLKHLWHLYGTNFCVLSGYEFKIYKL